MTNRKLRGEVAMPWLAADPVIVLPAHREALEALVRAHSTSQQLALRARMILHADVPLLRAYRGAFYLWVGTHYREYPDEKVEADLYAFLGEALAIARNGNIGPYNPTNR